MSKINVASLQKMKQNGEKFTVLTSYDSTFTSLINAAGVEVILVGDSLGMVLQGHDSTVPVTLEQMAYHVQCVARANSRCLLIGDLPFMSYATPEQTFQSATALMQAGAHMVKLEGGAWLLPTIRLLTERGIPVCGHLGLTPQSVNILGGYKVQGRTEAQAKQIRDDAMALAEAGAQLVVFECIPAALARDISAELPIPTIGIGAGVDTDGQVLVLHDMLGLFPKPPKFSRDYLAGCTGGVRGALETFVKEVKDKAFPGPEHSF
ncbi:MAG: 3-methyl-2-oxobutanoate hydroxymethyltransferase [Gammaproteobacteria bacterium]|nr:3-methyl-2-oxobutanoate hydroxymethyltransferase [Gammaproteobacteria bacterium]